VGEIHRPLLLIVSEIGEAVESHRKGNVCSLDDAKLRALFKLEGEEFEKQFKDQVKDTFEDELADTLIRLLDFVTANHINLEAHVLLKMKYNSTRERLHGKKY
jgi:NTP pyrophosphatase (non-canonical NTP hydrolase)